jgi:hypothetical protein
MARIEFNSLFADELAAYLRHREVNGLNNSGANAQMKRLVISLPHTARIRDSPRNMLTSGR